MEQEWIERIRGGDAAAFSEMVTAFYPGLFDYAYGPLTIAKAMDLDYSIVRRDVVFRRAKP